MRIPSNLPPPALETLDEGERLFSRQLDAVARRECQVTSELGHHPPFGGFVAQGDLIGERHQAPGVHAGQRWISIHQGR